MCFVSVAKLPVAGRLRPAEHLLGAVAALGLRAPGHLFADADFPLCPGGYPLSRPAGWGGHPASDGQGALALRKERCVHPHYFDTDRKLEHGGAAFD